MRRAPLSSDSDQLGSGDEPRFPDFDFDAEYQEHEAFWILTYGAGRTQVRKQLSDSRVAWGFNRVERTPRPHGQGTQDEGRPLVQDAVLQL